MHRAPGAGHSFHSALGRTYAAMLLLATPLLALLLTPGLMRSRVAWFEGSSWIGILGFELLSLGAVLAAVVVSAAVAGAGGWTPRTAWQGSRQLRRQHPRRWWRCAAEALGWFIGSQVLGGYLAWLMPYIWRTPAGDAWVLDYAHYAVQAVGIYAVVCLAAAWFGSRIRHEVLRSGAAVTAPTAPRTVGVHPRVRGRELPRPGSGGRARPGHGEGPSPRLR